MEHWPIECTHCYGLIADWLGRGPAPTSDPTVHPCSYPSLKNTSFPKQKIQPFFNPNHRFLGLTKHPFFQAKRFFFIIYKIKYPFCESENNCIKHMYIFFFLCTSYISSRLMHENLDENRQIYAKCLPFYKIFADLCLKNYPFYLISQICDSHWKNTPSQKWVQAWMSDLAGSEGLGRGSTTYLSRWLALFRPQEGRPSL